MNIIRGIDRIAIVLALIAMILAFFAGAQHHEQKNTGVIVGLTDEFLSFIKQEYRKEIDHDEFRSLIRRYGEKRIRSSDAVINIMAKDWPPGTIPFLRLGGNRDDPPYVFRSKHPEVPINKYKPPPSMWQVLAVGLVYAASSFMVTLFGIRLISRGIKYLSLWIIDGFKEEKKAKK